MQTKAAEARRGLQSSIAKVRNSIEEASLLSPQLLDTLRQDRQAFCGKTHELASEAIQLAEEAELIRRTVDSWLKNAAVRSEKLCELWPPPFRAEKMTLEAGPVAGNTFDWGSALGVGKDGLLSNRSKIGAELWAKQFSRRVRRVCEIREQLRVAKEDFQEQKATLGTNIAELETLIAESVAEVERLNCSAGFLEPALQLLTKFQREGVKTLKAEVEKSALLHTFDPVKASARVKNLNSWVSEICYSYKALMQILVPGLIAIGASLAILERLNLRPIGADQVFAEGLQRAREHLLVLCRLNYDPRWSRILSELEESIKSIAGLGAYASIMLDEVSQNLEILRRLRRAATSRVAGGGTGNPESIQLASWPELCEKLRVAEACEVLLRHALSQGQLDTAEWLLDEIRALVIEVDGTQD
jgi:hypothetical protein